MQRYQRSRHRVVWMIVGVVVGVMMIWGLLGRKGIPVVEEVPVEMGEVEVEQEEVIER
ncbi:MAG: hypothetical protein AAF591_14565 [Verrucomicrobiota bacterium]